MIVYGNLKAEGTFDKPIVMRGNRLDNIQFSTPVPYNNVAGQWGGVYLLWKGGNHVLKHVRMNSGYVGIYYNNSDRTTIPTLNITDCRIHNFLLYGLFVKNGNVEVSNSEISNTGSYSVYLSGGKHTFQQSTIANYFDNSSVQPTSRDRQPAVTVAHSDTVSPMETVFKNCIISGNLDNEFSLLSSTPQQYNSVFDRCYIRKTDTLTLPQFINIRWYKKGDMVFKSIRYSYITKTYFNFVPDSLSPVRGKADPTVAAQFPLDLNGKDRMTTGKPDMGAYQWQPTNP